MRTAGEPQHLSDALSKLIALKGLARINGETELASAWKDVAGPKIASQTKVLGIKRGVLQIGVSNAPLLSELVSFHKTSLQKSLQQRNPEYTVREIKFLLKGDMSKT